MGDDRRGRDSLALGGDRSLLELAGVIHDPLAQLLQLFEVELLRFHNVPLHLLAVLLVHVARELAVAELDPELAVTLLLDARKLLLDLKVLLYLSLEARAILGAELVCTIAPQCKQGNGQPKSEKTRRGIERYIGN